LTELQKEVSCKQSENDNLQIKLALTKDELEQAMATNSQIKDATGK